ncbi:MAG: hypothetical protein E5X90_23230, partial [Mesorhizobium sp.]
MAIAQNTARSEVDSARENLKYTPADRKYLALSDLEPNGEAAIETLAGIAASVGRHDTATALLGDGLARPQPDASGRAEAASASGALAYDVLRSARLLTPRTAALPLLLV